MNNSPRILVTGASGKLGRRTIEALLDANTEGIIATTRTPESLADLVTRGVEVRAADFDKPESLEAAFAGVDRLLLISTDAVVVPGQRITQHRNAIKAAERMGVRHILYTSMNTPKPSRDSSVEDDHFWTEVAIASSPMSWTFLRNGMYTDNLMWELPRALASGGWPTATGDESRSWVTREDCARVAAAALASSDYERRILDITGPEALTAAQVAAIASEVTGKPLATIPITAQQLREALTAAKMPEALVGSMVGFEVAAAQGYHGIVTSAAQDLMGQAPATVRDYLQSQRENLLSHP